MNLFEDIEAENDKYLNVIDALDVLAKKIGYSISDIAKRLLLDKFNQTACMFRMSDLEKIELWCSEKNFNGGYAATTELLELAMSTNGTFDHIEMDTFGNEYERTKDDWADCYWLKSDFFNFPIVKKIGVSEQIFENILKADSEEAFYDFFAQSVKQEQAEIAKENAKKISTKFLQEVEKFESNQQLDKAIANPQHDYKFFLFKKPLLTFHEASCIMTGYNPQYVEQCQNDTNFKQNFSNYLGGKGLIGSWTEANMLDYDHECRLYADEFKQFLANDGTFIDGFNDHLKNEAIDQSLDNQNSIIDQLKIENEKLKAELAEKEQKIKELESLSCKKDTDLLSLIFDEEKTEVYAPDLANAIKLWQSLYVENKDTEDKHSNRANHWILKNTPYKDIVSVEIKRLREITSPFESWHIDRKNKFNK